MTENKNETIAAGGKPNGRLLSPLSTRPVAERWAVRLLTAALAAGAYLLFLPWDLRNRVETPGSITETTPVTFAGVAGLVVVMLLLAGYLGLRDGLVTPLLAVAGPPAVLLLASFRSHSGDDGSLWIPAWAFFAVVMGAGAMVAAAAARGFRVEGPDEALNLAAH
ncbi:hypothetical protein OK074_6552 [Actinobacteria bacterium OK074]|nr:hypothetical protein OK074_6552 [Actinobacteria bacterium OK074]